MGKPSIAFRVMLAPLVFVLGLALLGRYALSIVAPAPDPIAPSAQTRPRAAIPRAPDPLVVKTLVEGPNRSGAAEKLVAAGYSDPAWLPAIELGLLEAKEDGQASSLRCLQVFTKDPAQLSRVQEILLHDVMTRPTYDAVVVNCALRALAKIPVENKAPMLGLVLTYAERRPGTTALSSEAVAGVRIDPLPDEVVRWLSSSDLMERVRGVGFAVSLGAGDTAPEMVDAARGTVQERVRTLLKQRGDPEAARFLTWLAITGRDRSARAALVERDQREGDVSKALLAVAEDAAATDQMRVGAIEFLAFRGRPGHCSRLEPLLASSSELVRVSAGAALMEPKCRS